jgi:hypothetical protein
MPPVAQWEWGWPRLLEAYPEVYPVDLTPLDAAVLARIADALERIAAALEAVAAVAETTP